MAKKRPTKRKPPSPAQLRARAAFTKIVKARAAARKNVEGFRDRSGFHPIRAATDYSETLAGERSGAQLRGVSRAAARSTKATARRYKSASSRLATIAPPRHRRKALRAHGRRLMQNSGTDRAQAQRRKEEALQKKIQLLVLKRNLSSSPTQQRRYAVAIMKLQDQLRRINPGSRHIPGLSAKYQRMYAAIKRSPGARKRYGRRLRTVAAATVEKAAHRRRNPSPRAVFEEFRGKAVTKRSRPMLAANGTPKQLATLGRLKELKLRGRILRPGNGVYLGADGRKKLHIVGARFNVRGNPGTETDVGEILEVVYTADKPHIEPGTLDYRHKFGEEGGTRPHLIIDREGYPCIEGGSYGITADGILD